MLYTSSVFLALSVTASKLTKALPQISQACVCLPLSTQATVPICRIKLFPRLNKPPSVLSCVVLCAIQETCPLEHVSTICHSWAISYAKTFGKKWLSRAGKPFPNSRGGLPSLYLQITLHPPIFACIVFNNKWPLPKWTKQLYGLCTCPALSRTHVLSDKPRDSWCIFRKNTRNFYRRIVTFMITKLRKEKTDIKNIFQERL